MHLRLKLENDQSTPILSKGSSLCWMTIKRLVRLVTVTLREDQQEFNIQRSPIEKKGGGERKRKKRKKKKKKDEAIDAFFFLQRKASSSRQG